MVQRDKSQNRSKSVAMLKRVLQKKVSICIFPEGTFNMTAEPLKDFYDGAFRIAIETQTPIQPIIFPDTIKRLNPFSFFSLTPGLCRGVYLEEITVDGMKGADLGPLKQLVFDRMTEALIRYRNK
jgi:1-acyl-sn-glycerol-3-phosphate acyltransferase